MIPGTVPWLLEELGVVLDDYDASAALRLSVDSTDSALQVNRAVNLLDAAQRDLFTSFLVQKANRTNLSRKATITQDSSDTQSFISPTRAIAISRVRHSGMDDIDDSEQFAPLHSAFDARNWGYRVEHMGERIRFVGIAPDTSYTHYAYVLEEPAHLSYGTVAGAETAAASMTLDATPDYGKNVDEDDYLVGAEIVVTSGTGIGLKRRVTDHAHATRVVTLDSAWTVKATDKYSIRLALPRVAWRTVVLRAAARACNVYPLTDEVVKDIRFQYKESYEQALRVLRKPLQSAVPRTRQVERLVD